MRASLLLVLTLAPAVVASAQTTRTQRGDTVVITTTGPGRWGASPRLTEELRLDGATHETTFGQVTQAWALPDGGVLVADVKSLDGHVVRRFDASGRFVGNIGRAGQGPGEFDRVGMEIATQPDGSILMRDGVRAVHHFGLDGRLVQSFALNHGSGGSSEIVALADGRVAVRASFLRGPGADVPPALRHFHVHDASGRLVDSIGGRRPWRQPPAPGEVFIHWWRPLPDGTELQSRSDIVGFLRSDPSGRRPPLIAQVPRGPVPYTREEREKSSKLMTFSRDSCPMAGRPEPPPFEMPTERPPARGYFSTDLADRVWVLVSAPSERRRPQVAASCALPGQRRKEFVLDIADPLAYAVFAADGSYLGDVKFPYGSVLAPGREHLWVVLQDADDTPYVVKYRLPGGG